MTNNKRRLLLITEANSYRIGAYLSAATDLGLEVLLATQGQHSLISEVHDGLHVDLQNKEAALNSIVQHALVTPFVGVLGIDDSTVELAAKVARELGLPHNNPDAAQLTRRKDLARAHLAEYGCAVPSHWLIKLDHPLKDQLERISYPCVLKPLAMSASRGVIRADDEAQFIVACNRIEGILSGERDAFEQRHVLVESYISGPEIAYEGFLSDGVLNTLVIFDKPDPLTGPYFEESIYVTPSGLSAQVQAQIKKQVALACEAYGLTTGPVHAELRMDEKAAWILEVAARTVGGDCARSLDNGSHFNLEALVISLAIGKRYKLTPPQEARGVMMIPVRKRGILLRIEGVARAKKIRHITGVSMHIHAGNELIPLPEGNQYPGFIFARADTAVEVVLALRKAYEQLDFVVAPVINTRIGAD